MKRFRIFEDSAPFSLVIKQSVQGNTSSEQQPYHWGPRFHIGCRGPGRIQPLEPRNKVEGKALEVRKALWKVEQESMCFATVKHDEHSTEKDNSAKTHFRRNVCSLGISCQNCWRQWNEKAQNTSVRNNTVQGPS